MYCDSLSDLTIMVSQDAGEVDMSSSLFQSNVGSFDIASEVLMMNLVTIIILFFTKIRQNC